MTRVVRLLSVIALACAACAVDETLPAPYCEGDDTSVLIVAQSVPSARFIPCIIELPVGWTVDSVSVNQDRTIVRLESDRAGDDAAVLRFEETCDIGGAGLVPSDDPGIERYAYSERIEPKYLASAYYRFEGGCWWWQFDFVEGVPGELADDVIESLIWISRDELNEMIAETFIDENL